MKAYFLVLLEPAREGFPANATSQEMDVVTAHFNYYQALTEKKIALIVGRTDEDVPIGIALLRADDSAHAERLMNEDPAIQKGIMRGRVRPFRLALSSLPL